MLLMHDPMVARVIAYVERLLIALAASCVLKLRGSELMVTAHLKNYSLILEIE